MKSELITLAKLNYSLSISLGIIPQACLKVHMLTAEGK